jgi:DNA-binding Lrp family transcriptional regulator
MLKRNEIILLNEIRKNSRSSITEISQKVNVPISTLFENLKKLESKVIKKYTSIPDYGKLNFSIITTILVKTKNKDILLEGLKDNPNVNNIERISNGYDILIQAIFSDMKEMHSFLEIIDGSKIESKKFFYLLDCIKKEEFSIGNEF